MNFILDQQTQRDLNLFRQKGSRSVFELFNKTGTKGGALLLEEMFRYPRADYFLLNSRQAAIRYLGALDKGFPFDTDDIDAAEHYLADTDARSRLVARHVSPLQRLRESVTGNVMRRPLFRGIDGLVKVLHTLQQFLSGIKEAPVKAAIISDVTMLDAIIALLPVKQQLVEADYVQLDQVLRFERSSQVQQLLGAVYLVDVFLTAARVARERQFCYPEALPAGSEGIRITGMYHPLVKAAVVNDIHTSQHNNVLFLTGANMAGKSTFMKAFGIAVFLAHIGFPVPAQQMQFAVMDGLFSTINLPDNIGNGYSHFYAEVMRVKAIAQQLRVGKRLVVIFDELFRGTNVKDAHDATVAVTAAMAERPNCTLLVSSHITEAARLLEKVPGVSFIYLPTIMQEGRPQYTYRILSGISEDRQGMLIIRNEGILELLQTSKKPLTQS